MPAVSDQGSLPALPRTWRPLGPRIVGIAVTFALLAVVAVGWFSFDAETRDRFTGSSAAPWSSSGCST